MIEEVVRIHELEKVPFTLPLRREMFGRLTVEQRLRRVGRGRAGRRRALGGVHVEPRRPDADRGAAPTRCRLGRAGGAAHDALDGLVETAERNVDAGNEEIALFEIARVYLPTRSELPDERQVAGIVEGGYGRAKGVLEALYDALQRRASARADAGAVPASGEGGADGRGLDR